MLIPDWAKESSYDDMNYRGAVKSFIELLKRELEHKGLDKISVVNFLDQVSNEEKGYLIGLQAKGSNLDMIKMHAIISNKDKNHLQMDTNVLIHDFKGLYNDTFGSDQQSIGLHLEDALNASYYDDVYPYVSAHNKIVYTVPNSNLATELEKIHNPLFEFNELLFS